MSDQQTPHDHREFVPGCFRCDLSRAEVAPSPSDGYCCARCRAEERE